MAYVPIRKVAMDACYEIGDTDYKYLGAAIRFANDAMRDLSLHVIPFIDKYVIKSEIIKIGSLGVAYMPNDFVYPTKVGLCMNGHIAVIDYDDEMCITDRIAPNCDCSSYEEAKDNITKNLNGGCCGSRVAFHNAWDGGNNYLGELYGYGAQLNSFGFYKYWKKENYMTFSGIPACSSVVVEYKSNGVGDGAALIPTEAENAVRRWINREFYKMRKDWSGYDRMNREYRVESNMLESLYSAMNKYQYRDALLGSVRPSIKR